MKKRIVIILIIVILAVSLGGILAACDKEFLRGEDFGFVTDKEIVSIDIVSTKAFVGSERPHTYIDATDTDPEVFRWAKKGIVELTESLHLYKTSKKHRHTAKYVITYADGSITELYRASEGPYGFTKIYLFIEEQWYETNKCLDVINVYFEEAYDTMLRIKPEEPNPFYDIRQIGIKQVEIAEVVTGKKTIIDSANSAYSSAKSGIEYICDEIDMQKSVRDIAAEYSYVITLGDDSVMSFDLATRKGYKEDIYMRYDDQWYFVHNRNLVQFLPLLQPALDQLK